MKYRPKTSLVLLACMLSFTAGCTYFPGVYKIDVRQGNLVTQEMVDQLRPGMTRRQVQFIMGTPLVRDTFNQSRWDYVYSLQPGGEKRQQESISLFFEDDQLTHFEGDFLPSEAAVE